MRDKQYWLETYGCQMNAAESASMGKMLQRAGWLPAAASEDAALVLLNTCSVRKTAESRIWGRLGFYKAQKKRHSFQLGLMGCMTERLGEEIRREVPQVDLLIGTYGKAEFGLALREDRISGKQNFFGNREFHFAAEHHGEDSAQAMVPIMHGCDNYCTYCIVPYLRGREVSRPFREIRGELERLKEREIREITLLGQNVNSYRSEEKDGILTFPELLRRIRGEIPFPWIRFMSSHPKDLSDELIRVIAETPEVCRHIHLPVQHGSNQILGRMNRRYTREDYLSLVERLRRAIPTVSLTTDILVGFPGETEQDFEDTLNLIRQIRFADAFTYRYNTMEGTKAYSMEGQIPETLKKERLSRMIDLQRKIGREEKTHYLGDRVRVLLEGTSKKNKAELLARTERNNMVVFPGKKESIGEFRQVRLVKLTGNTFKGEEVSCHGS